MSRGTTSLESVIDSLVAEGLLPAGKVDDAAELIESLRGVQPWYIRMMVGVGAWLASLLLIGFVGGFGLALGGSTVIGLMLVGAAVWVRRQTQLRDNDFVVQGTLAVSLAGQALLAWGLADLLPGSDIEVGCTLVIIISTVLFFIFPDRIHRVLMVLLASSSLALLVYAFEANGLIPLLGPLLATALVRVQQQRAALLAMGAGGLVRPLENGLMLSAFACLLLSAVYVLPELGANFSFYPRPWLSTLLLGALFLYVGGRTWPAHFADGSKAGMPVVYALILAVVAAAWSAPGILLALIVMMLGAANGHRGFLGAGIGFLVVFIGAWFYGIEVTMLTKSITLVSAGMVIFIARWLLLRLLGAPQHG